MSTHDPAGHDDANLRYRCVEPDLGDQLWRLDDPSTGAELRQRLDQHLSVCHACRLQRAVDERLQREVARGAAHRRRRRAWSLGAAALLPAACLALMFVLPPEAVDEGVVTRAGAEPWGIVRPVAGQWVSSAPDIAWRPLAEATGYRVEVFGEGAEPVWADDTTATELALPATVDLPDGRPVRVVVTPVPDYLGPESGAVTWFQVGSVWRVGVYRVGAAPVWLQLLLVVTVVVVLGGVWNVRRRAGDMT